MGTTNVEDDLGAGRMGDRRRDVDDGIDTWETHSTSWDRDRRHRQSHEPFTACERSEVARSSMTVVVNLSPYGS
jgi:hypothetical protein